MSSDSSSSFIHSSGLYYQCSYDGSKRNNQGVSDLHSQTVLFDWALLIVGEGESQSVMKVRVTGAGFASVNGLYMPRSLTVVPTAFAATCQRMGWPAEATWHKLAHKPSPAGQQCCWFASQQNDSYIYQHVDGQWWIDGPDGAGIYIANVAANDTNAVPPIQGWKPLVAGVEPLPAVEILE